MLLGGAESWKARLVIPADIRRPTVVLADDDRGILKAISRTLEADFDLLAAVADGREAVDAVSRLDPDVAVLDISMPGLDGFQAAEELRRSGSRARTVFLTMHHEDDFVAKALRNGAKGYVLKTLAWSELNAAVRDALAGRWRLPSLTPLVMADMDVHAVQFHGDDGCWLDGLASAAAGALLRGDTVATVLAESTRAGLTQRMEQRGWNLPDLGKQGRYLVYDAEKALELVLRSGRPDVDSLARMVAGLERSRAESAGGPNSHLTVIGEIAGAACRQGNPEAGLQLERLWNELTHSLRFLTICPFSSRGCGEFGPEFVASLCAQHASITHA